MAKKGFNNGSLIENNLSGTYNGLRISKKGVIYALSDKQLKQSKNNTKK